MVQFHQIAILISSLWWLELAVAVPLDSCWLQAIRKDCLNCKPSSILAKFLWHSSWDFFNFLLLHPTPWLTTRTIFQFIFTHSQPTFMCRGIAKITMCKWSQWGDVSSIEVKNHDVLLPETLWESFMLTHYNWLVTLWRAKVLKENIFSRNVFVNSSLGSQY